MRNNALRRPRAGLSTLACALAPVLAALAGCGGGDNGVVPDAKGTSAAVHMKCSAQCTPSNTLQTSGLEAHFYIVGDGTRTQAQAGFFSGPFYNPSSGFTIGYNVELQGDRVNFIQGTSSTLMELAAGYTANSDGPLSNLGDPYLVDIHPQPAAPLTGQFQMVRAAQTLTSQVTLPAPFSITSPAANATFDKTSHAVPIVLDSAPEGVDWMVGQSCTDTTGTNWVGTEGEATGFFSTADGRSYSFDAARYIAGLQFKRTDGSVAVLQSCSATVKATVTNAGTLAAGFATGSTISGIQLRSVTIDLK